MKYYVYPDVRRTVYIKTRLTRLASEFRGNILCFIMDTLECGTRNPTILFKCSSTEETKNHLSVTKMASNILLCKGQPKKPKRMASGFKFAGVFFQFINHVPFISDRDEKPQMEQKEEANGGGDVSKSPEKGWFTTGRRAQVWGSAAA